MSDQTLSPKRRRLLLAALMLPLTVAAWWYWPRGDSRLVGTWRYSTAVALPTGAGVVEGTAIFKAHGVAMITQVSDGTFKRCRWQVENQDLVLDYGVPQGGPKWLVLAAESLESWLSIDLLGGHERYPIEHVDAGLLRLGPLDGGTGSSITLRRTAN